MPKKSTHKLLFAVIMIIGVFFLMGSSCSTETVQKEKDLSVLKPFQGNSLEQTHNVEGISFIMSYNTGDYNINRWRITDSKILNMSVSAQNIPDGTSILLEHAHIDISLKSTDPELDGLAQDSMDDSYHGTSQDGFAITDKYKYENVFAIEGFSKDLIDGWTFITGDYGSGEITQKRLTEDTLVNDGNVYANKVQVVYDILIKNKGENFYHTKSIIDEFLIPVVKDNSKKEE